LWFPTTLRKALSKPSLRLPGPEKSVTAGLSCFPSSIATTFVRASATSCSSGDTERDHGKKRSQQHVDSIVITSEERPCCDQHGKRKEDQSGCGGMRQQFQCDRKARRDVAAGKRVRLNTDVPQDQQIQLSQRCRVWLPR